MDVQNRVEVVGIEPPPIEQRVRRGAQFAAPGEKRTRYTLPAKLESASPIGYRTRVALTEQEAAAGALLLSVERPRAFERNAEPVTEQELFEETALGILSARQSTNYRGHKEVVFGPEDSAAVAALLRQLTGLDAPVLDGATHTHVVFTRPYRTPFTLLLTFAGHKPLLSLATVPIRALRKRFQFVDDIPTIGYLQHLHVGILADHTERAALIASAGRRKAQVHLAPFSGAFLEANARICRQIEALAQLPSAERRRGWRIAFVAQVGQVAPAERLAIDAAVYRKLGANMIAFRSERIQPGVNHEEKAPPAYQNRQDMDVPDALTVSAGRAAYNAFSHWTGVDRDAAKALLLLERIDVLTPNGKSRLRDVRALLEGATDALVRDFPLWAELPTGRMFSKNAERGRKAFALTGQRIYIGGLDRRRIEAKGLDWVLAIRAFGAAASRSALVAELCGLIDLPPDCDLLAGICLMAGPVNQNDVGKQFYGQQDMLKKAFPDQDPTSLLVWTLKAKTVTDPIGNEEQLLNAARKGALVDLRPGPHEVISWVRDGRLLPLRQREGRVNGMRAFAELGNFVTDPTGQPIAGNEGVDWPEAWRKERLWT